RGAGSGAGSAMLLTSRGTRGIRYDHTTIKREVGSWGAVMAGETWTVRRLLEWTEDFLRKKGVEAARLEAQILLAHALGCKKIDLYVRHEEEPPEDKRTAFREMIKKRAEGMPVAYLVGHREFY